LNFDDSLLLKIKANSMSPQPAMPIVAQPQHSPSPSDSPSPVNHFSKSPSSDQLRAVEEANNFWKNEMEKSQGKKVDECMSKGLQLSYEKKFNDAIYYFNKIISTKPNADAYNYKG
jgi:hypothetical protein